MTDLPIGPGPLVGFINAAIDAGQSATAALDAFRQAGGAIANERWYQAYGALRGSVSAGLRLADLNPDAIVPPDIYTAWEAGTPGEFATFVEGFFTVPGQHRLESQFFIYRSAEAPTLAEAEDAAASFFTSQRHGDTFDGWQLSFVTTTSVAQLAGRRLA